MDLYCQRQNCSPLSVLFTNTTTQLVAISHTFSDDITKLYNDMNVARSLSNSWASCFVKGDNVFYVCYIITIYALPVCLSLRTLYISVLYFYQTLKIRLLYCWTWCLKTENLSIFFRIIIICMANIVWRSQSCQNSIRRIYQALPDSASIDPMMYSDTKPNNSACVSLTVCPTRFSKSDHRVNISIGRWWRCAIFGWYKTEFTKRPTTSLFLVYATSWPACP